MVPLFLLSLAQMSLKQWGSSWQQGHRKWMGSSSPLSSQLCLIPAFCKERNRKSISELPSLTKPLQQLRTGWGGWAEVGLWPKLCRAGEGWLLPCPVWSEPCWAHRAAWIIFMKQNPFWIYGMSVSLASMDFAWWEQQNISVIAGVPQLCTGPGAALHSGGEAALELCGL